MVAIYSLTKRNSFEKRAPCKKTKYKKTNKTVLFPIWSVDGGVQPRDSRKLNKIHITSVKHQQKV